MRYKIVACALALAASATAALADTHIGWYVAADVGLHKASSQKLNVRDVTASATSSSTTTSGSGSSSSSQSSSVVNEAAARVRPISSATSTSTVTGDIPDHDLRVLTRQDHSLFLRGGYQFTPHWRAELEVGDRASKIKRDAAADRTDNSGVNSRSHMNLSSTMLNVIYDIAPQGKIHPFVGLGGGAVRVKTSYASTFAEPDNGDFYNMQTLYHIHQAKTYGAWQGLAGLTWALTDRLSLDVTYRYLDVGKVHDTVTHDTTYQYDVVTGCSYESGSAARTHVSATGTHVRARSAGVSGGGGSTTTYFVDELDHLSTSSKLHDDSVTIGLRWAFAPPAPPAQPVETAAPPAPPPPAPTVPPPPVDSAAYGPQQSTPTAQTFTVYFAFDRSKLTDTALQVINSAATYARSAPSSTVTVTGHTDTAGSNAYNVALSMRRADAVAKGLVADGVDAGSIKTGWTGEKDLAVPTPNGTPNPENRRTTIDVAW